MQTINDLFGAQLSHRVREAIVELQGQLGAGVSTDLNRHNFLAGEIAGLRVALGLCEEVQSEINKR